MAKTMAGGKQITGIIFIVHVCYLFDTAHGNLPPVLESKGSVLIKAESTKVGSVLTTLTARDSDGPRDLVFTIGDEATGKLVKLAKTVKKPDNKWTVDVVLTTQLDRDFHDQRRNLLFQVTDGIYTVYVLVDPSQSYHKISFVDDNLFIGNSIPVRYTLVITDDNDETPLFLNLPKTISLSETTATGSAIYQVNVTDADSGRGGLVTYTLQLEGGDSNNPFKIDKSSGSISLSGKLDFEKRVSYRFNITAQDGGGLSNTSTLLVTVTDAQDTPPEFERSSYTAHIPENIHVGESVVTIKAKDGDTVHPNNVFLKLESGPCSNMFNLDANSGEITTKSKIDREDDVIENNNGICMLNITAIEDSGNRLQYGPFTSWTMVIIYITDVNDNHPIFNAGTVNATTGRHVVRGAPVVFRHPEMVTVYDTDRGPNGIMDIYLSTIGGRHDTMFQVSPQRAYSQAQIYLKVQNSTALRDYPFDILTVELYARETSSSNHVAMVTVSIDVQNVQTQCSHLPIVG